MQNIPSYIATIKKVTSSYTYCYVFKLQDNVPYYITSCRYQPQQSQGLRTEAMLSLVSKGELLEQYTGDYNDHVDYANNIIPFIIYVI